MPRRKLGIGYGVLDTSFPAPMQTLTGTVAAAVAAATSGALSGTGIFPQDYSLSRPLLANNPTALLAGNDWQGYDQALLQSRDEGGSVGSGLADGHSTLIDNPTYSTAGTPDGTFRAEIVDDTTFLKTLRHWQTDGGPNGNVGYEMRMGYSWGGRDKAWYRILMKYQVGFTNEGNPINGGAGAWKIFFATVRHIVINNDSRYVDDPLNPPAGTRYTGSQSLLPGSPSPQGGANWLREQEYDDEEWYEIIVCEERGVSQAGDWRVRRWMRRLTTNGVIDPEPFATCRKMGWYVTGTNVPQIDGMQMGITDNESMNAGEVQWYNWGPHEVIDGDVIADPYGLASDMLT